jgi:hypothetical protein
LGASHGHKTSFEFEDFSILPSLVVENPFSSEDVSSRGHGGNRDNFPSRCVNVTIILDLSSFFVFGPPRRKFGFTEGGRGGIAIGLSRGFFMSGNFSSDTFEKFAESTGLGITLRQKS